MSVTSDVLTPKFTENTSLVVSHLSASVSHKDIIYPPNLTELIFWNDVEENKEEIIFPDTVLSLVLYINHNLDKVVFPKFLQKLRFGSGFDEDISKVVFPETLTHLDLGEAFQQKLDNVKFPESLTHLALSDRFDQSLKQVKLSKSLTHLRVGPHYKHDPKEANLPESVEISRRISFW